ncbi:MAG: hypothetical protein NTU44_01240 [Bacteroidetes bacterium]|nr:hypothetical protein [Bacteroidota bacterium]
MKKTMLFSLLMITLMVIGLNASAHVWRVNAAPGASANFTSLQAAHDAVGTVNGDTIYLEGSAFSTGGLTCSKKLIIIGSGYFLSENPQTQANTYPSTIDYYFYFNPGSEGSKVMGCYFTNAIYLYVSNITIERNLFAYGNNMLYGYSTNLDNIRIIDNYFSAYFPQWYAISFPYACTNILISNNYIGGGLNLGTEFQGFITNNVLEGYITIYNATFTNNISTNNQYVAYNSVVTYNIGNSTQFGDQNGNQQNVVMTDVFVGASGNSTDGKWELKPGSPAIGAGEGGVDCGMFGGSYPYVLSGMPAIPAVYYFNAPSLPTNTINVSIKAKSHN